jgi:hypothetical protein
MDSVVSQPRNYQLSSSRRRQDLIVLPGVFMMHFFVAGYHIENAFLHFSNALKI